MAHALERTLMTLPGKVLMITGVRQGESAVRHGRIAMSCSKDGAECGQGWYQQVLPNAKGIRGRLATLAPILHWRVCIVWDWLKFYATKPEFGGWDTAILADAYGGDGRLQQLGGTRPLPAWADRLPLAALPNASVRGPFARERTDRRSLLCEILTGEERSMADQSNTIPIQSRPLTVTIVDGEIVLNGSQSTSSSFTSLAARETGRRLIEAADEMDAG